MRTVAELIESFCEDVDGCYFVSNLSGRFMHGGSCVGVTIYGNYFNFLVALCDYLHDRGVSRLSSALGEVKLDAMGTGYLMYFPDVKSEVEEDDRHQDAH